MDCLIKMSCFRSLALWLAATAVAAAFHPAQAADAGSSAPAAVVNGQPIARRHIDDMLAIALEDGETITPALRQKALESAIESLLLEQEARRRNLLQRPEFRYRLAEARTALMVDMLKGEVEREALAGTKNLAERIAAARAAQVAHRQYLLREIVVGDESLAKELLAQLQGGALFGELARKHSTDELAGLGGGYSSWADAYTLPPELLRAVESAPVGALVPAPVRAEDGWRIVQLVERREYPMGSSAERDEWAAMTVRSELQAAAWERLAARMRERAVIRTPRDMR